MENVNPKPVSRRWPLFAAGVVLFLLGPAIYAMQIRAGNLPAPWHVPILASLGVLLMIGSVWQSRSVWRGVALALFAVVCGLEWLMLLVGMQAPPYTGPALVGQHAPLFAASLAGGEAFTDRDLARGQSTILLFFRGRW
jgi:hypothetical protein